MSFGYLKWMPGGLGIRVAAVFLSVSYFFGAPLTAFLEYRDQTLSQRFAYSPEFIYFICAVQFVCSIGLLLRPVATWAAAALTVITVGAIVSHLWIGSPTTAISAVIYTAVQLWYGFQCRTAKASP